MLDPCLGRAYQRDCVVNGIHAHQRDVADTVADAGVADLGPEFLVADRIGRVKTDMAEAGDAGVAARGRSLCWRCPQ